VIEFSINKKKKKIKNKKIKQKTQNNYSISYFVHHSFKFRINKVQRSENKKKK
jgi:hypothetical protein